MGLEAQGSWLVGRTKANGLLHLDADKLTFRGEERYSFRIDAASATVKGARLALKRGNEKITIVLPNAPTAKRWAEKISNPRTRVQKLGVTPGMRVLLVQVPDDTIEAEIRDVGDVTVTRRARIISSATAGRAEMVLIAAGAEGDLDQLRTCAHALVTKACVWVLWPKGSSVITHQKVVERAGAVGLRSSKSMSFSGTLTALRFVK